MIRWPSRGANVASEPQELAGTPNEPEGHSSIPVETIERYLAGIDAQRQELQRQIAVAEARIADVKAAAAKHPSGIEMEMLEEEHRRVLAEIAASTALEVRRILEAARTTADRLRTGGVASQTIGGGAGYSQPPDPVHWPTRP